MYYSTTKKSSSSYGQAIKKVGGGGGGSKGRAIKEKNIFYIFFPLLFPIDNNLLCCRLAKSSQHVFWKMDLLDQKL